MLSLKVEGTIVGQKIISSLKPTGLAKLLENTTPENNSVKQQSIKSRYYVIGISFIITPLIMLSFGFIFKKVRKVISKTDLIVFMSIFCIFFLIDVYLLVYASQVPQPPFG